MTSPTHSLAILRRELDHLQLVAESLLADKAVPAAVVTLVVTARQDLDDATRMLHRAQRDAEVIL